MEKKKMTNKKKFWIGMSSLAAVGIITATVAYFSSVHVFQHDTLKSLGYSVSATKLLDPAEVNNVLENKDVDAKVKVKNEGGDPILSRVTYYWKNGTDESAGPSNAFELNNEGTELKAAGWNFSFVNGDKFLCDNGDGGSNSYYYKGTIGSGIEVQHLDKISYSGADTNGDITEYTTDSGTNWASEVVGTADGEKQTYYFGNSITGYLTVVVETIQATEANGAALDSDIVSGADVATLKGYWAALGKGTPAAPGGM